MNYTVNNFISYYNIYTEEWIFGKLLIEEISRIAVKNNSDAISLNVNRFNQSKDFYLKMGFEIIGQENLSIGNGYFMEDYKMEKRLLK